MPHELLEREDTAKKTIYNPHDPIATVFSAVKEILELANIMGKLYTHLQAVNISYIILHWMGKFGLAIHELNCMPAVQKTLVCFKHFPRRLTESWERRLISPLKTRACIMPTWSEMSLQGYMKTCNKRKLRRRHRRAWNRLWIMWPTRWKVTSSSWPQSRRKWSRWCKTCRCVIIQCHMVHTKIMEDVDITATNPVTTVEEDAEHKTTVIGTDAVVVEPMSILHITVGHTECVPFREKTAGTQ